MPRSRNRRKAADTTSTRPMGRLHIAPPDTQGALTPNQGQPRPEPTVLDADEKEYKGPTHASDPLIAGSTLVSEQWRTVDALGNRVRHAIYETDLFKYPRLRVEEQWSGKTGELVSRIVMVAGHLLVAPRSDMDAVVFEKRLRAPDSYSESERGSPRFWFLSARITMIPPNCRGELRRWPNSSNTRSPITSSGPVWSRTIRHIRETNCGDSKILAA